MSRVKKLAFISPILQSLLVNQIGKVMAALNEANQFGAWLATRNLIYASPPKVQNMKDSDDSKSLLEEVNEIEKQINQIAGTNSVNLGLDRVRQSKQLMKLLRTKTLPLFHRVMTELYSGGYLETYREYETGREIGY